MRLCTQENGRTKRRWRRKVIPITTEEDRAGLYYRGWHSAFRNLGHRGLIVEEKTL